LAFCPLLKPSRETDIAAFAGGAVDERIINATISPATALAAVLSALPRGKNKLCPRQLSPVSGGGLMPVLDDLTAFLVFFIVYLANAVPAGFIAAKGLRFKYRVFISILQELRLAVFNSDRINKTRITAA
jgi:hypothetical protein